MVIIIVLTVFIYLEQKVNPKNVCKNHDYCYIEMPEKIYIYILKYILGETNIKSQFVIYAKTVFT